MTRLSVDGHMALLAIIESLGMVVVAEPDRQILVEDPPIDKAWVIRARDLEEHPVTTVNSRMHDTGADTWRRNGKRRGRRAR